MENDELLNHKVEYEARAGKPKNKINRCGYILRRQRNGK